MNTLTRPTGPTGPTEAETTDQAAPDTDPRATTGTDNASTTGSGHTSPAGTDHASTTGETASASNGRTGDAGDTTARRRKGNQADGMAVASFILGLVGLLVMNVLLGPLSIVLGTLALYRRTERRGRAFLGIGLGIADLVVLAALTAADGTVSWSFAG